MAKRSLIWHLFPSYLLVVVASLLAALGYTAGSIRQFHLDEIGSDLEARAALLSSAVTNALTEEQNDDLQAMCREMGTAEAISATPEACSTG